MRIKKTLKIVFAAILFFVIVLAAYLFTGSVKPAENIVWGVNFSQKYAGQLGFDWKEIYTALLDDLGAKNLKIAAHWDILEPEKDKFNFDDLDWQIMKAKERGAKVVPVIGMKTSRWPECHIPNWAKNLSKKDQQKELLKIVKEIVLRYKDEKNIAAWQVENEPFFPFGECPWVDKEFLKEEVVMVHETDPLKRPVIISDSGEGSFWISAARIGDVVGTTMYKKVWFSVPNFLLPYIGNFDKTGFYVYYPFPPTFYGRKAEIIGKIFKKDVIDVELQAEPWAYKFIAELPQEEQEKTMDLEQFKYNIDFAKKTGLGTHYLWGAEWWYWMKEKQQKPEIWDEAKKLFQ